MFTDTLTRNEFINTNSLDVFLKERTCPTSRVAASRSYEVLELKGSGEYMKAQNFLQEYGRTLVEIHGLDVSYKEIKCDNETILSWYSKDRTTLKSLVVVDDEDGFEIQLSTIRNGRRAGEKYFSSFRDFTCEI